MPEQGFYRRFRTGSNAKWVKISIQQVRSDLTGNFKDVDLAIEGLRKGLPVSTMFAEYHYHHVPEEVGDATITDIIR